MVVVGIIYDLASIGTRSSHLQAELGLVELVLVLVEVVEHVLVLEASLHEPDRAGWVVVVVEEVLELPSAKCGPVLVRVR